MPRLVIVLGLLVASAMSRLTPSLAAGLGTLLLVTITAAGWIAFRYWDLLFDPERWVDVLRVKARARPTCIFVPAHVLGGGCLDSLLPLHEEFLRAYRAQK